MDEFAVMLLKISEQLRNNELKDLKFLCCDKIPKKTLESISSGTDLFTKLCELDDISRDNLDFLIKLLQHIKRNDLIAEVKKFQTPLSREENNLQTAEDEDRMGQAFDIIADNVGREWKRLMRYLGVTDPVMEQVIYANPYNMREQIIQCLREWKKKKQDNATVPALIKALESCRMKLVAERITEAL
ncbi:FAS-associated death domain protein [Gastrophryne carolinensis]